MNHRPTHNCGRQLERIYFTKYDKKSKGSKFLPCINWFWCNACKMPVKIQFEEATVD